MRSMGWVALAALCACSGGGGAKPPADAGTTTDGRAPVDASTRDAAGPRDASGPPDAAVRCPAMLSLTPTTVKLDGALTLSGDVLPLRDVTGNKVAFAFSPVAADAGTPFTLEAPASIDGMTPITFDVIAPPAVTGVFEVVVTIPDCGDYTMPDQVTVTR